MIRIKIDIEFQTQCLLKKITLNLGFTRFYHYKNLYYKYKKYLNIYEN